MDRGTNDRSIDFHNLLAELLGAFTRRMQRWRRVWITADGKRSASDNNTRH